MSSCGRVGSSGTVIAALKHYTGSVLCSAMHTRYPNSVDAFSMKEASLDEREPGEHTLTVMRLFRLSTGEPRLADGNEMARYLSDKVAAYLGECPGKMSAWAAEEVKPRTLGCYWVRSKPSLRRLLPSALKDCRDPHAYIMVAAICSAPTPARLSLQSTKQIESIRLAAFNL